MTEPTKQQSAAQAVLKFTEFINVYPFKQLLYAVLHGAPRSNINAHTAVSQATKIKLTWHAPLHHLHIRILCTFGYTELLLLLDEYP